ncbi:hypothetical protein Lepto7375DRAFT_7254 [Leptolyngbya sp. PCC 7375]|nr:hypothetical protein Lepto7375DRAFT_7254 [Leptolyngbya sp. PCC 7375]
MSACRSCNRAISNGGECREFLLSDGYYTWLTPVKTIDEAKAMNTNLEWSASLDIIKCTHNGFRWIDDEVVEVIR